MIFKNILLKNTIVEYTLALSAPLHSHIPYQFSILGVQALFLPLYFLGGVWQLFTLTVQLEQPVLYSSAQLKGSNVMQAVSLTLSLAAKNIPGMQLPFKWCPPHLHVAPTREYHCYPDVMFTFIPSAISDMFCHLLRLLLQDICACFACGLNIMFTI